VSDKQVLDRIGAWQAAGLIDAETAERLRAAELAVADSEPDDAPNAAANAAPAGTSMAASFFGPSVSIGELFGYLGGGFLLAAWHTLIGTQLASGGRGVVVDAIQFGVPAIAFALGGWWLLRSNERARRAAGVAFLVSAGHVFGVVEAVLGPDLQVEAKLTIAAAAGLAAAIAFRRLHPAVLTQVGLVAALLGFAGAALTWLNVTLFPFVDPFADCRTDGTGCNFEAPSPDPNALARVLGTAAWWILWAVIVGLIARREARRAAVDPDPVAAGAIERRTSVTRFAAGLTAVLGLTSAVMQSGFDGRALPPVVGDAAILVVAVALFAIAFRNNAGPYLYPAALGVIIGLSDLNGSYLAQQLGIGVGLLVEGVILLAAGFLADRLRRRLAGGPGPLMPAAPTEVA
jgi:hypothetical protein